MEARLVLEDGSSYRGQLWGAPAETGGEVVFNTSMTGYQELLTDPSYFGQIVVATYPLIGNYGISEQRDESYRVHVRGFVVREAVSEFSHWSATAGIDPYLREAGVVGLCGVDTRALTKRLREAGTLRGIIATGGTQDSLRERARSLALPHDPVAQVSLPKPQTVAGEGPHVVIIDYGMKRAIARRFHELGARLTILPSSSTAEEILDCRPDGVVLSNGPGDPADLPQETATVRELLGQVPLFGICLGHQLLARACGARTYKLKFGHRGSNHPVRVLQNGAVVITAQNHGYAVAAESLKETELEITQIDVNDQTVEGLAHSRLPAYSVQYHPEGSPGPRDAEPLFEQFLQEISGQRTYQGGIFTPNYR